MKCTAAMVAAMIGLISYAPAQAEDIALEQGAYEVAVRLELPHVEDAGAQKVTTICIDKADPGGTFGLVVLSENNPLRHCPASNVHHEGDTLTFDIKCPGGNAAIASAKYTLLGQRFDARIAMKMGGKNMTMTEVQSGHRAGACPVSSPHS